MQRFKKGDEVDVIEGKDDEEDEEDKYGGHDDFSPWRGIVLKWREEESAYEISKYGEKEARICLHTSVHRRVDLRSGDNVVVLDKDNETERCGVIDRRNGNRCRVVFDTKDNDSIETVDISLVWPEPYEVGDYVMMKSSGASGRICAVWMRGYVYNVRTETGRTFSNVPRTDICVLRTLRKGERVKARWGIIFGGNEWLPGRITHLFTRTIGGLKTVQYDIQYDNGEKETGVDRTLIRRLS